MTFRSKIVISLYFLNIVSIIPEETLTQSMEYESSDPKRGDVYEERFEVSEYDGSYTELEDLIEDLTGVFEASVELNKHAHPQDLIEGNAGITIIYDTLETDRTQICLYIEDFNNTTGKATSA